MVAKSHHKLFEDMNNMTLRTLVMSLCPPSHIASEFTFWILGVVHHQWGCLVVRNEGICRPTDS